jgi:hypothetical protein
LAETKWKREDEGEGFGQALSGKDGMIEASPEEAMERRGEQEREEG